MTIKLPTSAPADDAEDDEYPAPGPTPGLAPGPAQIVNQVAGLEMVPAAESRDAVPESIGVGGEPNHGNAISSAQHQQPGSSAPVMKGLGRKRRVENAQPEAMDGNRELNREDSMEWIQNCVEEYISSFTIVNWPWEDNGPHQHLGVEGFAGAGLQYFGPGGKSPDSVYCPYCDTELWGWTEHDLSLEEHKKTEYSTGRSCMFLDMLIGRHLDFSKDNQIPQYETYNTQFYDAQPGPSLGTEEAESLSKTSDEDRAKIREQAKMVINVQERKKELARKMIAQCPICEGSEKIVVKSCRHVNCANYINCCGGFCMICGDEITAEGLIALKIRMPSRPITVS